MGESWSCGRDNDQWGRQGLVVDTRTSGETRSCGGDKDQWGDKVLWWRQGPVGRQGLVVETGTSGGVMVLW